MMKYMITFLKYAHKKGHWEEDDSTIESSQVSHEFKNLFDFDDLCKVKNTPV